MNYRMKLPILLAAFASLLFANAANAQLKIYYIRHAEGGHNVKKQWQDKGIPQAEWPAYVGDPNQFTPKGLEQVTAGTQKLQKYRFDFIASSSMWRARNTVLPYLKLRKQKAEVWPGLMESPGGRDILADDLIEVTEDIVNKGRALPELPEEEKAFFEYRKDTKSIHKKAPKGSSRRIQYAYTKKVMLQVIERLQERFGGTDQSILLVGHNSSGTALMKLLLQSEPAEEAQGPLDNFGMWMVEQQEDGSFELKIHNDRPYETKSDK